MSTDFSKYLTYQKKNYTEIYAQLQNRYYDAGWIEYILPRLETQCDSPRSYGTGLESMKAVQKFWSNKRLRTNYLQLIKVLNEYTNEEYNTVISERGRYKIKQSVELFLPYDDTSLLQSFLAAKYA